MAKKIQGSNLRILSIAYATGRMDRDTYLKLRTQQLGAMEFNKPIPQLPEELVDISVPSVKLDAPYIGKRSSKALIISAIIILLLIGLGGGGYYAFQTGMFSESKTASTVKVQQLTPEKQALKMINQAQWSQRDIELFLKAWSSYSAQAKHAAREAQWYVVLENEIIQRINKLKLQQGTEDAPTPNKKELNNLRSFYGQLVAD